MSDILALIELFVAEFGLYQVSKLYSILFSTAQGESTYYTK